MTYEEMWKKLKTILEVSRKVNGAYHKVSVKEVLNIIEAMEEES